MNIEVTLQTDSEGFWADKLACWQIRECAPEMCQTCGAYLDQSRPCWDTADTPCKKLLGRDTCSFCDVLACYGTVQDADKADGVLPN